MLTKQEFTEALEAGHTIEGVDIAGAFTLVKVREFVADVGSTGILHSSVEEAWHNNRRSADNMSVVDASTEGPLVGWRLLKFMEEGGKVGSKRWCVEDYLTIVDGKVKDEEGDDYLLGVDDLYIKEANYYRPWEEPEKKWYSLLDLLPQEGDYPIEVNTSKDVQANHPPIIMKTSAEMISYVAWHNAVRWRRKV